MEKYVAVELAKNFLSRCNLLGLKVSLNSNNKDLVITGDDTDRIQGVTAELQYCPDIKSEVIHILQTKEAKTDNLHSLVFEVHKLGDVISGTEKQMDALIDILRDTEKLMPLFKKISRTLEEMEGTFDEICNSLESLVEERKDY